MTATIALAWPGVAHAGDISAVWANEGGDKVTQDELRASQHVENLTGRVVNRVWDGHRISLFAAKNEVVSFDLVLEAATTAAHGVSVVLDSLDGPGGASIRSKAVTGDGVFDWVDRDIELFYARYLPIHSLSYFGYPYWDDTAVPVRFRQVNGGGWSSRPDHDKAYPDPLVPIELVPTFDVAARSNQSIWADVYVPKTVPCGTYTGQVVVREGGATSWTIPVTLTVYDFALPDVPTVKTFMNVSPSDIMKRYVTNGGYAGPTSPEGMKVYAITDKFFQLFHRHKIDLIGENDCAVADHPCDVSVPRLTGSLYTAAHGYDGPGVGTPTGVYGVGIYGTLSQSWGDQSTFVGHADAWATWFAQQSPSTEYFMYLVDEPPASDYAQTETWAQWLAQDPGPGRNLLPMATLHPVFAQASVPDLAVPTMPAGTGDCPLNASQNDQTTCDVTSVNETAAAYYRSTPGKRLWAYNASTPGTGSDTIEDDGIALRELPWGQYKKGIARWYYWYVNPDPAGDWFANPVTFGSVNEQDPSYGAWNTGESSAPPCNGDGLMVYPGTDLYTTVPGDDYGVGGPIASVRLKEWRRGIQDADYLALAAKVDAAAVKQLVDKVVPAVLWEYAAGQTLYPEGYVHSISWSVDPDDWEAARAQLAKIITGGGACGGATDAGAAGADAGGVPTQDAGLSEDAGAPESDASAAAAPAAAPAASGCGCRLGAHEEDGRAGSAWVFIAAAVAWMRMRDRRATRGGATRR